MSQCTTRFSKEWTELRIHKEREVTSDVKIILDKSGESNITVYLEGLHNVSPMFEYKRGSLLLYATVPKDNDCTEEDKMRKIAETVADGEIIYERIQEHQIIYLQSAFDEFNTAKDKIYSIKEQMVNDSLYPGTF